MRLWDATTGEPKHRLTGQTVGLVGVAFSPDGNTIAGVSRYWKEKVRLWDATTGELTDTLAGHTVSVSDIAFSPDGNTLASADYEMVVRLWDAEMDSHKLTITGK